MNPHTVSSIFFNTMLFDSRKYRGLIITIFGKYSLNNLLYAVLQR